MGLLSLFKKIKSKSEQDIRILLLGIDNAGKTTILKQLTSKDIEEITPSAGFHIERVTANNCKLIVWDIAGGKNVRLFWKNYLENTDVLIYVVDTADKARFNETKLELYELLLDHTLVNVPLLVFANKQDLPTALKASDLAKVLGLSKIKNRSWQIQECVACQGHGLKEGLDWICDVIKK